jgi:hypothetical protein
MRLLRRKHAEPEPAAGEDRSEEEAGVRVVGEPDPAKVTVRKDTVTGRWASLKGM